MTPFIVAELSANHLGSLGRAVRIIDAAARAGADAVKLQTFSPDEMAIPGYVIPSGPWAGRELRDLYREAHTPREWHEQLFATGKEFGIEVFSTPFSKSDVDFLEKLKCPRYKISSFELVDDELLMYVARTWKPIILSTGMATTADIDHAVWVIRAENPVVDLTLLKCTSGYPAPLSEANLVSMTAMNNVKRGVSDHTLGHTVAMCAAFAGADVIEKHLTLNRDHGGPDAGFSLEPDEFAAMVKACREAAQAWGRVRFGPTESEMPQLALRRSLWVIADIAEGEALTRENVASLRPADGLPPRHYREVLGRTAVKSLKRGTPLRWEDIKQ